MEQSNAASWFIARAGESEGPYTWRQMRSAAHKGLVRPRDWVWQKGMRAWVRAEEQEGLLSQSLPPPVPQDAPARQPPPAPPKSADLPSGQAGASSAPPPSADLPSAEAGACAARLSASVDVEAPQLSASSGGEAPLDASSFASSDPVESSSCASGADTPLNAKSFDTSTAAPLSSPSLAMLGDADHAPSKAGAGSLGETTRQFLAAAGISQKVRRRRQRNVMAGGLAALVAIGVLGTMFGGRRLEAPEVPSTPDAVMPSGPSEAAALRRAEACQLTGDCPPRRTRSMRRASADKVSTPAEARRGDVRPEALQIGPLATGGVKSADLKLEGPVELEIEERTAQETLTEAQTVTVKDKAGPVLKQCKGVFARTTVVMRLKTDKRGKVTEVSVPRGPLQVRRCLQRRAKYWRFGAKLASQKLELTVPAKRGVVRVTAVP